MTTIEDVAKRAGVSMMTVSRVINGSGDVSPETRERVERVVEELGYVPNALARGLRFKQTKTIALVLTDITNPFFTTIARGVEDVASRQGFSVIFCNTDESEHEEGQYINVLLQKQVDGVLLVPACSSAESISLLQSRGVPVVVLDRRVPGVSVDTVHCNSEQSSYRLVRHLVELGHRRVAVLTGPQIVSTAVERVAGAQRAIREAGLDDDMPLVYYGEFTQASGYHMAQQALAAAPGLTALFATNNFVAMGALRAVREAGLRMPEDVSLVAFDDIPAAFVVEPFLTVISQPAYDVGKRATELLLNRLAGQGPAQPQEIVLPTEFILRRSSAPPPTTRGVQRPPRKRAPGPRRR
ncbi:MAG: LacI family DNA-binding transcriptional regulator [Anaerolineae bacterium]